jgi:hypothetical protein
MGSGKGFWGRRSLRGKLLIIALAVGVVVIALGLGLGLGLGLNNDNGGGSDGSTSNIAPLQATPTDKGIWMPSAGATWQIVLLQRLILDENATSIEPNVDVYDIDLFTNPKSTIDTLHRLGKKVICYFSAGSYEPDRPDSKKFKDKDMGRKLDGWPLEKWLDLNSPNVRQLMSKRMDFAAAQGCDAVDPDNTDAYVSRGQSLR